LDPVFLLNLAEEKISLFPTFNETLWTIINFSLLAGLLYYFLYKPLINALNKRDEEIEGSLRRAKEDREEAARLRAELEERLANAQREANEIINKATQAANATKEQIEAEARARAEEMLEKASRTIALEKAQAIAELRAEVADLAVMIAGKVIEKNLDDEDQKRLAESFLAEAGTH